MVGTWDGALAQFPGADKRSGYDCSNLNCTGGTATKTTTWTMAGVAGTVYNVTVRVSGAFRRGPGLRLSGSGTSLHAGSASISSCATAGCDSFQRGGTPMASGGVSYDYNNYELSVSPGVPTSVSMYNTYYLNSVIMDAAPKRLEQHHVAPDVPGVLHEDDCRHGQQHSDSEGVRFELRARAELRADVGQHLRRRRAPSASRARCPVANFTQPYQGNVTGAYGQWVHFDVTGVTVAP